jgi:hypothetical protein
MPGTSEKPRVYQVRIRGSLDPRWTDRFEGMSLALDDNGDTLLRGPVTDQAALHGLLKRLRDLGMPLISITCEQEETTNEE